MVTYDDFLKDHRFIRKRNMAKHRDHNKFVPYNKVQKLGMTIENIDEFSEDYRLATEEEIKTTWNTLLANNRNFNMHYNKNMHDIKSIVSHLDTYGNCYVCEYDDYVRDELNKRGYYHVVRETKDNKGYVITRVDKEEPHEETKEEKEIAVIWNE